MTGRSPRFLWPFAIAVYALLLAPLVVVIAVSFGSTSTFDFPPKGLSLRWYGAFFGSVLYSKWYDLEPALHDLDIDIKDLQKVFGRDGSTCQVPVPPQPPLPYP